MHSGISICLVCLFENYRFRQYIQTIYIKSVSFYSFYAFMLWLCVQQIFVCTRGFKYLNISALRRLIILQSLRPLARCGQTVACPVQYSNDIDSGLNFDWKTTSMSTGTQASYTENKTCLCLLEEKTSESRQTLKNYKLHYSMYIQCIYLIFVSFDSILDMYILYTIALCSIFKI